MPNLKFLTEIPEDEQYAFDQYIKSTRKKIIFPPKETVGSILKENAKFIDSIKNDKQISKVIKHLRQEAFSAFLIQEAKMNAYLLKQISQKFKVPKEKFDLLYQSFQSSDLDMHARLQTFFGDFSGQIYPYIYRLSLSNTQSRRSRAGKIFEGIIYGLYDTLEYPYESQASIGSQNFKSKRLGKIVDSLLPSLDAFEQRRDKVIIGTMKTTLRERWQEVIEEINRTGLPSIYLLTVDDDISASKVEQMANHNVILVVYQAVKQQEALIKKRNVISFEDYFFDEIPQHLAYWAKQ